MTYRDQWDALFPDPWPGTEAAVQVLFEEIRGLRELTDTIVTTLVQDGEPLQPSKLVADAHDVLVDIVMSELLYDLVGQTECERTWMRNTLDVLCWVLRHDHNNRFVSMFGAIQQRLTEVNAAMEKITKP